MKPTSNRFKAFCKRRFVLPSFEKELKKRAKATVAARKRAMKPMGVNSILKEAEYTTGRLVRVTSYTWWDDNEGARLYMYRDTREEIVSLKREKEDSFDSRLDYPENAEIEEVPQITR